ncbi:MAG: hypothetical protein A3I14_05060 [Candidatus Rokubacteria bacterium RIFCSPLOWO2_02_FULL_73_56]|nr:MAG: hypothetical protein A3D33_00840 [Candidatus Rokubacteria bacterium RIFCSPHIGHO2_02_FULL_73_26]OGL12371.1 MAG: hypothetical protein A3I14_05060 [Candidatus Rokubacteria bacterium RIFCSPLOWO2_02_FULL_73_56]OGL24319.1 MAG: hypothetical protein A3G44_10610 [Candidatus Rokubacteria bacterium RIFCSPLOWO2_12_FULL_73_47]
MGENAQTRWWRQDGVGYVVIDNPPMNVLSDVNRRGMLEALGEFQRDGVRAVVLTGAGDRAFCGGADLKEEERLTPETVQQFLRRGQEVNRTIRELDAPVIAAINGWTMGGGLVLALWCDLRVGSTRAKLGAVGVKVGLMASNVQLARLVPEARARDALLTGRTLEAAEALAWGLLSAVVPPEELLREATAWARRIAARPAALVAEAKRALNRALEPEPGA